jgi:hypothetical protein
MKVTDLESGMVRFPPESVAKSTDHIKIDPHPVRGRPVRTNVTISAIRLPTIILKTKNDKNVLSCLPFDCHR